MHVARQAPAEPCDERDDVEPEPDPRDDLGGHVRGELAGGDAQADPIAQASEERTIDSVADPRGGRTREHQLAHEDARELGLRRVEREEGPEDVLGLVGDRAALRHRVERRVDGGGQAVLEDERDEILLGARVEEDRPLRDAGARGDLRRGGRVEPALDEERGGGLADAGALVLLVRLAAHD